MAELVRRDPIALIIREENFAFRPGRPAKGIAQAGAKLPALNAFSVSFKPQDAAHPRQILIISIRGETNYEAPLGIPHQTVGPIIGVSRILPQRSDALEEIGKAIVIQIRYPGQVAAM